MTKRYELSTEYLILANECYYIAVCGFAYVQESKVEGFIESCERFNVEFFKECDL